MKLFKISLESSRTLQKAYNFVAFLNNSYSSLGLATYRLSRAWRSKCGVPLPTMLMWGTTTTVLKEDLSSVGRSFTFDACHPHDRDGAPQTVGRCHPTIPTPRASKPSGNSFTVRHSIHGLEEFGSGPSDHKAPEGFNAAHTAGLIRLGSAESGLTNRLCRPRRGTPVRWRRGWDSNPQGPFGPAVFKTARMPGSLHPSGPIIQAGPDPI